jgi:uridine phosphorylase
VRFREQALERVSFVKCKYPILEFDLNTDALINPSHSHSPIEIAEHCVPCFFTDVIDKLVSDGRATMIAEMVAESGVTPVYEVDFDGCKVALFNPGLGGPSAAKNLEKVIALGCSKFVACGGAGVLDRDIPLGRILVPQSAVRDEGTSYHYMPPSREAEANPVAVQAIENVLKAHAIPYVVSKTWTTDAFYRSTPEKIRLRKSEGCLTVEMECAAFFAVAQFRGVLFGQLLYGGDDLGSDKWDSREWTKQASTREKLFWLAAQSCLAISDT